MPAATLRKRVTFQASGGAGDGGGGRQLAWSDAGTVWGGFKPERGGERLDNGRVAASLAGVLTVRSSVATRAITEKHRVLIDGAPFAIRSVSNPDQRNRWLEFTVEEGVAT